MNAVALLLKPSEHFAKWAWTALTCFSWLVFAGCYIYCIAAYGFLFGVGLGWLPSIIVANATSAAIVLLSIVFIRLWSVLFLGAIVWGFYWLAKNPIYFHKVMDAVDAIGGVILLASVSLFAVVVICVYAYGYLPDGKFKRFIRWHKF